MCILIVPLAVPSLPAISLFASPFATLRQHFHFARSQRDLGEIFADPLGYLPAASIAFRRVPSGSRANTWCGTISFSRYPRAPASSAR